MKIYEVDGWYKGNKIDWVEIDSIYNKGKEGVKISLWKRKENYDSIPPGEPHYDLVEEIVIVDKKGYISLLFDRKSGTTARKYLKLLGLKVTKVIV